MKLVKYRGEWITVKQLSAIVDCEPRVMYKLLKTHTPAWCVWYIKVGKKLEKNLKRKGYRNMYRKDARDAKPVEKMIHRKVKRA